MMKTSDFDYHLPESSIAQTPAEPRDSSRLLVLHRDTGELEHRIFRDVADYLSAGDLLVLNQTRVIPARIFAHKETGGRVEILLSSTAGGAPPASENRTPCRFQGKCFFLQLEVDRSASPGIVRERAPLRRDQR